MFRERARTWLVEHPEVLAFSLGVLTFVVELGPDLSGGTSAFLGP